MSDKNHPATGEASNDKQAYRERRDCAISELNYLCAKEARCNDQELVALFCDAGIEASSIHFFEEWYHGYGRIRLLDGKEYFSGIVGLKRNLKEIAGHRKKYTQTLRGYFALQAYRLSRGNGLPMPGWVDDWLFSGLIEYDLIKDSGSKQNKKIHLEELLKLVPGKQKHRDDWFVKKKDDFERELLLALALLVFEYKFHKITAKAIINNMYSLQKYGPKKEYLDEVMSKHSKQWKDYKEKWSNEPFFDTEDEKLSFYQDEFDETVTLLCRDNDAEIENKSVLDNEQKKRALEVRHKILVGE